MGDKTHFLTQKSCVEESTVNSDVIETACFCCLSSVLFLTKTMVHPSSLCAVENNGRILVTKRYLSLHGCRIIAIVEAFVVPLFFKVKQNRISSHLDLIKLLESMILNMNEDLQETRRDIWEILFSINIFQKS